MDVIAIGGKDVIAMETIEDTTYVSPSIDRDTTSLYVSA
jgi:hypothetical protein